MALERLTRISGPGISSDLSLTFSGGVTVSGGIITATSIDVATFDTNSSGVVITGVATATSFKKTGGSSSEFLKADGTVDTATYATQTYVGLATVGLSSVSYVNTQVGLATAGLLSLTGSGSNLTGIVTYISAGSGISINQNTGNVSITATGGGGSGGLSSLEVASGTTNVICTVMGSEGRTQAWVTYWPNGTTPPNGSTAYYPYSTTSEYLEFNFRIAIGYQSLYTNNSDSYLYLLRDPHLRKIVPAQGDAVGFAEEFSNYNRNSSYMNVTTQMLPIRNNSGSNINVPVYYAIHCVGGTYNGANVFTMTPENSSGTTYSTVNSVGYGCSFNTSGSYVTNGFPYLGNSTITIPAGKTVLVGITECAYQITTQTANRFSAFYRLSDTFANANIQCDLRMVETMAYANFYNMGWTTRSWNSGQAYKVWNMCGTLYGDR